MKTLFTILFLSSAAHAATVGDFALYDTTVSSSGHNQIMEQKIEITAVDTAAGKATLSSSITMNGQVISAQNNDTDLDAMIEMENTLDHCSHMQGTVESLTTPAGTFQVCHLNQGPTQMFLGKVPFGIVKMQTQQGPTTSTMLLKAFKKQ